MKAAKTFGLRAAIDAVSAADLAWRASRNDAATGNQAAKDEAQWLRQRGRDLVAQAAEDGRASVASAYRERDLAIRAAIEAGVPVWQLTQKDQGVHIEDAKSIRFSLARTANEATA